MSLEGVVVFFSKSLLFGLMIPTICCREGLRVGRSLTQIPQAAKKGVLHSLLVVVILDGMITFLHLFVI